MVVSLMLSLSLFFGVAQSLPVTDTDVSDGQIVVVSDDSYSLSTVPYDPHIVGVVTTQPSVYIDLPDLEGKAAVISSGVAKVSVSTANGAIEPGDFVTSSEQPGVGMKATRPGFVLGVAQEAFAGTEGEIGQIEVAVAPRAATPATIASGAPTLAGLLTDFFNLSAVGISDKPSTALRYAVATLILLISFVFGLLVFGRVAAHGIAAMGRNPLARYAIGLTVGLNLIITVFVIAAGVGLAYVVLVI